VGPAILDEHHLARYCRPRTFDDDGKPTYAAFLLRAATAEQPQEEYVSAFWIEVLNGPTLIDGVANLKQEVTRHNVLKPAKNGKYAVLNVGHTRATVNRLSPDRRWLRVTVEPPPFFHAEVHDTSADEETVSKAIFDSVLSYHPAT
jgi:hypothetical protein